MVIGELSDVFDCPRSWKRAVNDKRFSPEMPLIKFIDVYREHWNDVHSPIMRDSDEFDFGVTLLTQEDLNELILQSQAK